MISTSIMASSDTPAPLEKIALETYVPPAKPSLVGLSRAEIADLCPRRATLRRDDEHFQGNAQRT
jgi:hypothetical protein